MRTHTDELVEHIKNHAPKITDEIKKIYDAFDSSKMLQGPRYYKNESDILNRPIYTYVDGIKVIDPDATNEKIPSGLHKILVDQKVAYLAGEPMVFGSNSDNAKQLDLLKDLIGERWEDTLPELIKNASNKGLEWLHPFINEEGEFDYMIADAENVIPLYDNKQRNRLVGAIRFYHVGEKQIKLELWTAEDVTYYEIIDEKIYLDAEQEINPAAHFYSADESQGKSWGKVPFVKFANNAEELSDLHFNKRAIDAFEMLMSDAQNTLADMPEVFTALVGYDGTDLQEYRTNLKRFKVVKLDDDGDIKTFNAQVPTDAYSLQAEMLRKNIITSGQGVDPSPDVIGDAPSGVALEHLYSLLDMKASMLERKFTLALREFMSFIEVYCREANAGDFDARDVTYTLNKMLLTNEKEIIDMASSSVGIISNETIRENHPWVKDTAQEQERLKREQQEQMDMVDNYETTFKRKQGELDGEET